jgi:protein subunit release factor B
VPFPNDGSPSSHGFLASAKRLGFRAGNPLVSMPAAFQDLKLKRLAALGLAESDFEEKFARSSGPGGQHVNKVSTAVTLRHVPTGLAVTVQDSRSQSRNRQLAWERLLTSIERTRAEAVTAAKSAREKARRQKAKRPWALKQRILEAKKRRSQIKKLRGKEW